MEARYNVIDTLGNTYGFNMSKQNAEELIVLLNTSLGLALDMIAV